MPRSKYIAGGLVFLAAGVLLTALTIGWGIVFSAMATFSPGDSAFPTSASAAAIASAVPPANSSTQSPTLASDVRVTAAETPTQTPGPISPRTPTPPPRPTSTRTPRPSATPTSTPTPTPTASETPEPTLNLTPSTLSDPTLLRVSPTVSDTTAVPTAVPAALGPSDAINIVLLGSDRRPDWMDWHTDVVQVVSVQPEGPSVSILSIPRDLYVYIPGFWMSRINFADMYGELYGYDGGGPALVRQTLLYNLGIPIAHYVRVDFDGFIGIVDILGGVDIPVHCRLEDHWPYPDEKGEYPIRVLEPGVHHMDGETALWYARSRKTSSVFARERRQQQVLEAIWRKSRSLDILPRLPQLWNQYRHMVTTDLTLIDVARLAEVAFRLESRSIRTRSIGYQHVIPWTTPKGGSVFLPNWEEIEPLVTEVLGPAAATQPWTAAYPIEVWNGTENASWDQLAADRLLRAGFPAVVGEPDRRDYPQTQLLDFTPQGQAGAASYLRWMFQVAPENVIAAPNPEAAVKYRLIIGGGYQTCRGY